MGKGDYIISGITLNRFFALHVVAIPLILVGLVFVHLVALHHVGSNNPDGIDIKNLKIKMVYLDGVAFHPYYTMHDMIGIVVFFIIFFTVVFSSQKAAVSSLSHQTLKQQTQLKHLLTLPLFGTIRLLCDVTCNPIYVWFSPARCYCDGSASIAILFVLPWLDKSPVRSMRYKGMLSKIALAIFVVSFLILGYLG